jgi:DNA-binding response OmpR family regulator
MSRPNDSPDRVLVVDDEDDIRESLMDYLEAQGFLVLGAPHGKRALEMLADPTIRPCVVVLDLMMPVMDGRAFRHEQLRMAEIADIPVVLISAYTNLTQTAGELGIAKYLVKPIDPVDFLEVIRSHCRSN